PGGCTARDAAEPHRERDGWRPARGGRHLRARPLRPRLGRAPQPAWDAGVLARTGDGVPARAAIRLPGRRRERRQLRGARRGAGAGRRTVVYWTVSTGIGCGIVRDRRIVVGRHDTEGGHMVLWPAWLGGAPRPCGGAGRLAGLATGG